MQPIPVPVKNVNVYPYLPGGPVGPIVTPIIEGAEGVYSVGTLTTHVFYNLDLKGGERTGQLQVNGTYYATATVVATGETFQTPGLYCTAAGQSPTFGGTDNMLDNFQQGGTHIHIHLPTASAEEIVPAPNYITVAELKDVNVAQLFPPPAIGQIELIAGAQGQLIATRFGTPHLMGFRVEGGERMGQLQPGMQRIAISGKRVDNGQSVALQRLKCIDAGNPAIFLQSFPGLNESASSQIHVHVHR